MKRCLILILLSLWSVTSAASRSAQVISDILESTDPAIYTRLATTETLRAIQPGRYAAGSYTVDINSISRYVAPSGREGVELYFQVSEGAERRGFSGDGSVDIERLIVMKPPVYVDDPAGPVTSVATVNDIACTETLTLPRNASVTRRDCVAETVTITSRYRQDPGAAFLSHLADTIALWSTDGDNIIPGKVGRTLYSDFPDAGSAGAPTDGSVGETTDSDWATIQAAAGDAVEETATPGQSVFRAHASTTDDYQYMHRAFFQFDVSSITDGSTIDDATLRLYGEIAEFDDFGSGEMTVAAITFGDDDNPAAGDYANIGAEYAASRLTIGAGWDSTGAYNSFTLNATAETAISTAMSGTETFSVAVLPGRDFDDMEPTWGANDREGVLFSTADEAATTQDPNLQVNWTATGSDTSLRRRRN